METNETMAAQWQALQENRGRLIKEISRLQLKMKNLPSDPEIEELLNQKTDLKKRCGRLSELIVASKIGGEIGAQVIAMRKLAKSKREIGDLIESQVEQSREVAIVKKIIREGIFFDDEEAKRNTEGGWVLEAPLSDLEEYYHKGQVKLLKAENDLQEMLTKIDSIEDHYRQTKKCLHDIIDETRRRAAQCEIDEINWATQDQNHLQWIIAHKPDYKQRATEEYYKKNPGTILPQTVPRQQEVRRPSTIKTSKHATCAIATSKPVSEENPITWRFFAAFNGGEKGNELTQGRQEFIRDLKAILTDANYQNLDPGLVYDKLMGIIQLDIPNRQMIGRALGMPGWKKWPIGKHRLFLKIDEPNHTITISSTWRKSAYGGH